MKSVRFSQVVKAAGKPEAYLVLTEPEKDRHLRTAIKGQRVMTVLQEAVGHKADRGEVGFAPGNSRQFLMFPKSLKRFKGKNVVGIKYDQLSMPVIPKSQRAKIKATPRPKKRRGALPAKKMLSFASTVSEAAESNNDEVTKIKAEVRHAMKILESGKHVAAYNLLKRIVED